MYDMRQTIKDSVFMHLFSQPEYLHYYDSS